MFLIRIKNKSQKILLLTGELVEIGEEIPKIGLVETVLLCDIHYVYGQRFCVFLLAGVPKPTFYVASQFVSWSAHPFEPLSET